MPRATRRTTRLVAAAGSVLAGALALTACGPVHAGAAATIGNIRISDAALKAAVNRALDDPTFAASQSDVGTWQRTELSTLISDQLLVIAAKQEGVSVSEGEVGTELASVQAQEGSKDALDKDAAQNGIPPEDIHDYFYYVLLEQKLAPKITTPMVHAAHILVKDQATAQKILAEVEADPSQFAALAKSQSIDTTTGPNGGDLGTEPSAEFVTPFADAVDSAPVGGYFVVHSQFGWHVVHLISRTTATLDQIDEQGSQATTSAEQSQAQQVHAAVFSRYLSQVAKKAGGVSVNPRYGAWSDDQAAVVASTGSLVSPAPSKPAAADSAG